MVCFLFLQVKSHSLAYEDDLWQDRILETACRNVKKDSNSCFIIERFSAVISNGTTTS